MTLGITNHSVSDHTQSVLVEIPASPSSNSAGSIMDRFCAAPVSMFNDGHKIVCVRLTDGSVMSLDSAEGDVLACASEMKPIAEHTAVLCERDIGHHLAELGRMLGIGSANAGRIREKLKEWRVQHSISIKGKLYRTRSSELASLRAKGLLLTDSELLARLNTAQAQSDPDVSISSVCIPSASRPVALARCVKSFAENLEHNGRYNTTIVVLEDSDTSSYKEAVERARASTRIEIKHVGLDYRERLSKQLANRTGIPRPIADFALCQPRVLKSSMPARNAFTLMTLDSYVFYADDDTCCAYAGRPSLSETIITSSTSQSYKMQFFKNHEDVLCELPLNREVDILGAHEQALGKSVASTVARAGTVTWGRLTPDLLMSLYSGTGHIVLTSTGCIGDSGLYGSGGYLLDSTEETIARMCESTTSYEVAVGSGKLLRIPSGTVVSRGTLFQSMSYAADNTCSPLPYFPMGRNADSAYAHLCLLSDSQAWIAHLPLAIHHESDAGRKPYFVDHTHQFSRVRLCDILCYALNTAAPFCSVIRNHSLATIGEQLIALGGLSSEAFKAYVREEFIRCQTKDIELINENLAAKGWKYPLWEKDVRRIVAEIRHSLTEEASIIPADLETEVGTASALEVAQDSIRSYGQLLCSWKALVGEARYIMRQAA